MKMAGALELKSPVLLGYPDESIEEESVTDYWVSKIGGKPVSTVFLKVQSWFLRSYAAVNIEFSNSTYCKFLKVRLLNESQS